MLAREAGVSYYTVLRHLRGRKTLRAEAIEQALKRYDIQPATIAGASSPHATTCACLNT
jgi:DNA-binding LacI/PurR family transcriptional regulator